ncbi:MAG: DUF3800 domain-containing protein, partial [Candidatus Vogelbacteria bacterium]|nr:DUF3800 domain-containing protein [Candidatus Vogelbacteria bacterium]
GDPGFKFEKGSSRYFVISLVIFDDDLEAEKTALEIKKLKRELGFPDDSEFKFSKSRNDVKKLFLETVSCFKFRIRCLTIDKKLIHSHELQTNKNSFYGYAIKQVLKYSNDSIFDARIKIDGSGDRIFRKNFLAYLRKNLNSKGKIVIKNCKLVDSRGNVLIQLADMIAGAIRRACEGKKEDVCYKNIIKKRLEDEWFFK